MTKLSHRQKVYSAGKYNVIQHWFFLSFNTDITLILDQTQNV